MPMEVSRDVAVDAARSDPTAAARDHEVSVHKNEEEKGTLGAKASWSFVSTSPAASVHPIEEVDDNDLPFFHDNDLPSFHIKRLLKLRFQVAANRNGNSLLKQQSKEVEFSRCSGTSTVVEQGAAVRHNHTTARKEDDERQKRDNFKKLSDVVVPADVVPGHTAALPSHKLSDGKLGVMSSSSSTIPQEQDVSFDNKPQTRGDLPAEASKNGNEEAEEIAAAEALNVEFCEAPNLPTSLVTTKSQEEMDMAAATSRESAVKGEIVVPFADDLITSSSDETEPSHLHAAKEEQEAIEVPTTPTSIKDAARDVSLPDPQDLEEESKNKHDEKQGESASANDELPIDHYYTAHNGDILDPSDSDSRSSQGCDSVSSFATIHTRSDGDSSKLCERSSVSDVVNAYTDFPRISSSRSIGYSSSILSAYSGSILYPGAPNHSGSMSHRSDSSAASNHSFAFPIFATEGNSSPARMAQPDRRYLRRKKWWWRTSCTCCSRVSSTYY